MLWPIRVRAPEFDLIRNSKCLALSIELDFGERAEPLLGRSVNNPILILPANRVICRIEKLLLSENEPIIEA